MGIGGSTGKEGQLRHGGNFTLSNNNCTSNWDLAGDESLGFGVVQMVIVGNNNGNNGNTSLNSHVECSLLERQHVDLLRMTAGAFWEDPDAGLLSVNIFGCLLSRGNSAVSVGSVQENGLTQSH